MKIYCISDTHGFHDQLTIPSDIDMVIHSGDCSNIKSPALNVSEVELFLKWFEKLDVHYKVFIAGNHDTSIEAKLVNPRNYDIVYLEHESISIQGIKYSAAHIRLNLIIGRLMFVVIDYMNIGRQFQKTLIYLSRMDLQNLYWT